MEVAGVFIERTGALLVSANAEKTDNLFEQWDINNRNIFEVTWSKKNEVKHGIRLLGEFINNCNPSIDSVAVASYGPFESLNPKNKKYAYIHKNTHAPLTGIKLKKEFTNIIGDHLKDKTAPNLTFHTDVSACALGESILRQLNENEILGYLAVTNGIGIGIVHGRTILNSALHPEIGLIPVRLAEDDRLMDTSSMPVEEGAFQYSGSLEELTGHKSTLARQLNFVSTSTDQKNKDNYNKLYNLRAYYLAQACLSFVAINPPHYIVIGTDIDPRFDIEGRVRYFFKNFIDERLQAKQPMFEYDELQKPNFISLSVNSGSHKHLSSTGTFGMCHAAAAQVERSLSAQEYLLNR